MTNTLVVNDYFEYNPETGSLVWKYGQRDRFKTDAAHRAFNTKFCGREVGSISRNARTGKTYKICKFKNESIRVHRLIFEMINGPIAFGVQIDHINGDGTDNRLCNLRAVSHQENQRNLRRRSDNSSGVTGVTFNRSNNKWVAQCSIAGKHIHLGCFETVDAAAVARQKFNESQSFHSRHGEDRPL